MRDSQIITHFGTSRPLHLLFMAEQRSAPFIISPKCRNTYELTVPSQPKIALNRSRVFSLKGHVIGRGHEQEYEVCREILHFLANKINVC